MADDGCGAGGDGRGGLGFERGRRRDFHELRRLGCPGLNI